MKNEKGITLVELLVAVVISGIVIIPLLTIMTGTYTRTLSQGKETEIAYVAQEVMEKIRQQPNNLSKPITKEVYCYPNNIQKYTDEDCNELLPSKYIPDDSSDHYLIKVDIAKYKDPDDSSKYLDFYEVKVAVLEDTKVVNGGENSTVTEKENSIELVTVLEIK